MDWTNGYIAVDWGTTNRRAYRVDGNGALVDGFEDDRGVLAFAGDEFDRAVQDIRQRLGQMPMLLAGMVGSNRGWREAPYVECPADARALARAVVWIDPDGTGIVPGVCQRGETADIMRGEEVQAIGAAAMKLLPSDALVCHPGTHSKWICMSGGKIRSFRTVMTGELFGLLQKHSILGDRLDEKVFDCADFRAAARAGLQGSQPTAHLFGIRARALLEEDGPSAAAFASGLLIGAELRAVLETGSDKPVALIGRPDLCSLYAAALEEAGRHSLVIDGSKAFLGGIAALTENF